jgi:Ca-activated chloride channel family protein
VSFIWPPMLLSVALVPLGILLYLTIEERRGRRAAAHGGLGLAQGRVRRPLGLRGRISPFLFVAAFTILAIALARPQAAVSLPRAEGTVILAFDVSASMTAVDIKPTRMDAAKAAAKAFVERQPAGVVIGIVAFSDAGLSVQVPSNDQAAVMAAIDRLSPGHGTSLGQGILAALNAVAQAESGTPADYYSNRSPQPSPSSTPVPPGSHSSAVIVLLSDGENNEQPDPLAVAQTAADRGIRIDTVGIGSVAGTTLDLNGFKVHTQLDEATLQGVARITDGTYYSAADATGLHAIYENLDTRLVVKSQQIEITALLAGAGILLLVAGGITSLAWLGRMP